LLAAEFALAALAGNSYVLAAEKHVLAGDTGDATTQANRAREFLPWASEPWLVLADSPTEQGDVSGGRIALREALARDRNDWTLWVRLAAIEGREVANALRLLEQTAVAAFGAHEHVGHRVAGPFVRGHARRARPEVLLGVPPRANARVEAGLAARAGVGPFEREEFLPWHLQMIDGPSATVDPLVERESANAPECVARPRGGCLPPEGRRADQGRPRHRQR